MTERAASNSSVVERARRGLAIARDKHVGALVAACRSALASGDPHAGWLIADRLCRILGESEATPYLLRSAASAILGDGDGAHRDLERAIALNPEHPDVLEAMLRGADPAHRKVAAIRLAPRSDALAVLAENGVSGFLRFRLVGENLTGKGFWNGQSSLDIAVSSSGHRLSHSVEGQETQAGPFGWEGDIDIPWPANTQAVTISGELPGLLIEPPLLRSFPATPPATHRALTSTKSPNLMIVVPVHGDPQATHSCFEFLAALKPSGYRLRVIAVDDASPHPEITALLDRLAAEGRIILVRHPLNLGFAASVNQALGLRDPGEDVLLLNSDAYLPQGALETLRAVVLAAPENGTATPFSNNGEDVSLPRRFAPNPLQSPDRIRHLDALARRANGFSAIEIPNGVGFCLYVRAAVVEAIGGLSHAYERGYFEDVDFCLRARRAGFRNLCATGAYVGHSGSLSFGGEKRALVRRNLALIHASFPEYRALADTFAEADPLRDPVKRLVVADLPSLGKCRLIVAPDEVPARILADINRALPASTLPPLVLRAANVAGLQLDLSGLDDRFPGKLADAATDDALPPWLASLRPEEVVFIDPAALPPSLGAELARRVPQRAVAVADHAMADQPLPQWCPHPPALVVTSAAMASLIRQRGETRKIVRPVSEPRPKPAAGLWPLDPTLLAVIPGETPAQLLSLIGEYAPLLHDRGISLVVAGAFDGDLTLFSHSNLWVSGAIEARDIPGWLAGLGIRHCLFTDPRYGVADPLVDALQRSEIRTACFGPIDSAEPDALRLDPANAAPSICRSLTMWIRHEKH